MDIGGVNEFECSHSGARRLESRGILPRFPPSLHGPLRAAQLASEQAHCQRVDVPEARVLRIADEPGETLMIAGLYLSLRRLAPESRDRPDFTPDRKNAKVAGLISRLGRGNGANSLFLPEHDRIAAELSTQRGPLSRP